MYIICQSIRKIFVRKIETVENPSFRAIFKNPFFILGINELRMVIVLGIHLIEAAFC